MARLGAPAAQSYASSPEATEDLRFRIYVPRRGVILSEVKNLSSIYEQATKPREILRFAQNDSVFFRRL